MDPIHPACRALVCNEHALYIENLGKEEETFIQHEEGVVLHTYDDKDGTRLVWDGNAWRRPDNSLVRGYPTIGRGRQLWPGETITTCTIEQANAWFDQRLAQVDLPGVDAYWPDVNHFMRGALCDYSFNCGNNALPRDGFRKAFDSGGYEALGKVWLGSRVTSKGAVSPVLVGRRAREFALFCHPLDTDDVATILANVQATGAQMIADLPSLSGVILSDDEDPH